MVDVPRSPEPTDAERLFVYLSRMTPGGAGGQSRAVGPVFPRDAARAVATGSGADEDSLDARESKIDVFAVTGTGTATFTLTYSPLDDSWNPSLNGITLDEGADYSIDDRTLTITSPTTLFAGASGGDPWELRVQYDYLAGVPVTPTGEVPALLNTRTDKATSSTATLTFSTWQPAAGTLLMLAVANANGGAPASPSGYTQLATVTIGGVRLTVFTKTADGTETSVSSAISGSAGNWCATIVNYQPCTVMNSATASAAAPAASLTSGTVTGALAVDFLAGLTGGFKSGSMLANAAALTDVDSTFIGYLGLQVGTSTSQLGGFADGWGMDGLDQVTGDLVSIVVGLEA